MSGIFLWRGSAPILAGFCAALLLMSGAASAQELQTAAARAERAYAESLEAYDAGDLERARLRLEEAYLLNPRHDPTLHGMAYMALLEDDWPAAEGFYRESLALMEAEKGVESYDWLRAAGALSKMMFSDGRFDEAEPLYRRLMPVAERLPEVGPDHPDFTIWLNDLAQMIRDRISAEDEAALAEVEALYRRAAQIAEASFGPDHPRLGMILNNLGHLFLVLGDFAQAEPLHRRAVAIGEAAAESGHPEMKLWQLATWLTNLAILEERTGKPEEAARRIGRALELAEQELGDEDFYTQNIREAHERITSGRP